MAAAEKNKKGFLPIPVKVVLCAAAGYTVVWALGLSLDRAGVISLSGEALGMSGSTLMYLVQAFAASAVAAIATRRFLYRPLETLLDITNKAVEGNYLVRAPIVNAGEIGELAQAFNKMMSKLTDITATRIQTDQDIMMVDEQMALKSRLEEKSAIIERTNKTLEQLVRDLSLIYEIGQEVNSIVDLEELYANITETLKRYLRINELAILLFDERKEELFTKAAYGFENVDDILRTSFRVGEGITGLVAQSGKKIYIKDTSRETRFLHYKGEAPSNGSSFLSIPLMYKDEVMGVINFSRRGIGSFTYQDVKMLSLVANQVALAIANAKLYTRTRELSVKDELTGINNRRYFQQMLQMEWKRAVRFHRPLSLIMVDVDHFKLYNDTFGHLMGDKALKQIGDMLRRNLREVDTVARFGGEEFVLLLPDTDKRGAMAVAEKVRLLVEGHTFLTDDHKETRVVTLSSGISTYPDDIEEMDDLIDHADIALYRAKELGRNRIECYVPPSADSPVEKRESAKNLPKIASHEEVTDSEKFSNLADIDEGNIQ